MNTLAQDAGQLLVAGFAAGPPPVSLLNAARRGELGGYILFARNLPSLPDAAALVRTLRAHAPADPPPWIAVDQEGGRVARLEAPLLTLPPMRVLGVADDVALTERVARTLGAQLHLLGFNLDFAPVLDVDTNPANPVIGDRAFGTEPERVIRHGRAFVRGLQASGIAACGKHFPGHGDTELDSHLALPRVTHPRTRLDQVELAPFAALAQEMATLMTAHVVFDGLDPERPATLSADILQRLLRESLGFTGLVFSDDLEMKAISDRYSMRAGACAAVEAGCDVLLVCSRPDWVHEVHEALVERGEASSDFRARLAEAAQRSRNARLRYPGRLPAPDDVWLNALRDPDVQALQASLEAIPANGT